MMCGIAGVRRFDGAVIRNEQLLAMGEQLRHRGPDESAIWSDLEIGFSHTRLSIIDIDNSHQPMRSVDGRWALVFNGEIFNYGQLRSDLDYPFRTNGDTEVILAGLAKVGIDFVNQLRGQFAFAAHDRTTGTTHLVRDRLGILPLYYRLDRDALLFASEIKAISAALPGLPDVDLASLDAYLTGNAVPAPHTLFKGTEKLRPGCRAEIDQGGRLSIIRYWSPPPVDTTLTWTDSAAIAAVDAAVRDAVRAALVADVPVGSYLSGGVDSSLIAAVMKDLRGGVDPVKTFAAGFGDPKYDELPWAQRVSGHLGTEHHEVHVRSDDFEDLWPKLTWHRDAPVSQPADVAVFRLAQQAQEHVKVVLSGEGGDELFGGYQKYRFARILERMDLVPDELRRVVGQWLSPRLAAPRAKLVVRAVGATAEEERFQTWFAPFSRSERQELLGGSCQRPSTIELSNGTDVVDRMLRYDLASWLSDNLLERGDRMSMAASLELRPPFLDHRLVELAFTLPSSLKVRGRFTKWVLKEVARRYLPDEVVDRRKVGFRVPLDHWFRTDLRDSMWDRLTGTDSFVGQTFDRKAVTELLKRHGTGRFREEARIWTLMSLEIWHETLIRGRVPGLDRGVDSTMPAA
jgi:asparagine synthase (glutamine-hydrolysing)